MPASLFSINYYCIVLAYVLCFIIIIVLVASLAEQRREEENREQSNKQRQVEQNMFKGKFITAHFDRKSWTLTSERPFYQQISIYPAKFPNSLFCHCTNSLSSLHISIHHCTFCASLHVKTSPATEPCKS